MKRKFTLAALCAGLLLAAGAFGGQDIFEAVTAGTSAKVKAAVDADPQVLEARNNYRQTPLILAIQKKKIEVAEYLLACGADVNAKETSGATPLSYAITGGFTGLAKTLVERQADINAPAMWNMSPLLFALELGRKDIAEMLADKGAALPVEPGEASYRALLSACSNGSAELVDRMLEKGFTIGDNPYSRGLPLPGGRRRVGRDRRKADPARLRHGPEERIGMDPAPRRRGKGPHPGRGDPAVPRRGDRRPDASRQERVRYRRLFGKDRGRRSAEGQGRRRVRPKVPAAQRTVLGTARSRETSR
ncbi:MAG: ankyrin repeat domain-containing protein [Candidatus Moduliflexus flocculans]|nr:ankyrin repeat domain-containing protein [Candidatus Moduliflexus flocculans]